MTPRLIAITGGIGTGKSVVRRILAALSHPVYDCDSRAKAIMDADPEIHRRLNAEIHHEAVVGGTINRPLISSVVFNDKQALLRLNAIVHDAVRADIRRWLASCTAFPLAFVETAIPVESRIADWADQIWQVEAPLELRISRVQRRSKLSPEQIRARIASQSAETITPTSPHFPKTKSLQNDSKTPLLPQIKHLLSTNFKKN